jgi:hypothetical protein
VDFDGAIAARLAIVVQDDAGIPGIAPMLTMGKG